MIFNSVISELKWLVSLLLMHFIRHGVANTVHFLKAVKYHYWRSSKFPKACYATKLYIHFITDHSVNKCIVILNFNCFFSKHWYWYWYANVYMSY